MTFESSRDWPLIKAIATDPQVYRHVSDDFSPEPSRWEPIKHVQVSYVLAKENDEIYGLFALIPENTICWKAHPCLLPKAFGEKSRQITAGFIEWLWKNTPCMRLIAEVPKENQIVKKYALDCGMVEFGVNEASLMKGGKLHDQILYGISKPKELIWA
jgi:hypothetical protein